MDIELYNILIKLADGFSVIALLLLVVRYFIKKENKYKTQIEQKEQHIRELNEEARKNDKESLLIINKLTKTIDKFVISNENTKEELENIVELLKNRYK
jgi:hypothetical protein